MVAMIVLGAAYSVVTLRAAAENHDKPRASLEKLAADSLTVLNGLSDANGTILDQAMTEQYHCSRDLVPSTASCASGRGTTLSEKLQFYLPAGASYAISLDNGIRPREIYRASQPVGEAVGASFAYVPGWNLTFVATELSCYDSGMDVNATLLPIAHARSATPTRVVLTVAGSSLNATAASAGNGAWNATFNATARPASATLVANATARSTGSLPGLTTYASCSLGSAGNVTIQALRQSALTLPASVAIGQGATLSANLDALANVSGGADLLSSNLTIYEPLPDRPGEADTWIPSTVIALGSGTRPTATWTPPDDSLFGAHPVVLRALMKVGSVTYEARLVGTISVALPNGVVPLDPPYRATMQAWIGDWH